MCVLARDEWRNNSQRYNGLCALFVHIIEEKGLVETDDKEFNAKMSKMTNGKYRVHTVKVADLIPQFVRPSECEPEAALFWWPIADKDVRLNFLQDLVMYYANLIDHEEDEK